MIPTQRDKEITLTGERIIGNYSSGKPGPTVVFFGGIHGNEPAGYRALENVFKHFEKGEVSCEQGTVLGIRGNLPAISTEKRFLEHDLNRLWSKKQLRQILQKEQSEMSTEEKELIVLYTLVHKILKECTAPFYFIDIHTTSSETLPFITINDSMINRRFAELFPVPVILGIEEYLEGPLLSYINEKGYLALGFESGQHQDPEAVNNAEDFIWLTLLYSGILTSLSTREENFRCLKEAAFSNHHFYEVYYRHKLSNGQAFKMEDGYRSFQRVPKGSLLANEKGNLIEMKNKGILFMPLYQKQGEEGFFLIRRTPRWVLRLSTRLRKWKTHRALSRLPGIRWADEKQDRLLVNLQVARFLSKPLFHLLGFRIREQDATHLILNNREHKARNRDYEKTFWYAGN